VLRGGMINMRKLDVDFHKLQELNSNIELAKLTSISVKYVSCEFSLITRI